MQLISPLIAKRQSRDAIIERSFCLVYFSLNANLTANAASITANVCWRRFTALDEFTKYALTPLASIP